MGIEEVQWEVSPVSNQYHMIVYSANYWTYTHLQLFTRVPTPRPKKILRTVCQVPLISRQALPHMRRVSLQKRGSTTRSNSPSDPHVIVQGHALPQNKPGADLGDEDTTYQPL